VGRITLRLALSLAGVGIATFLARALIPANPTTAGFAYLLVVLVIASTWGFVEASVASIAATLAFNFFFFPPVGTFAIRDPQNWVALFSFLATAIIASRLSAKAERRAREAIERQRDVERLYTFSRAILLIDNAEPFPTQLTRQLQDIFELEGVILYDRRAGETYRAGLSDGEGLEEQLRDAAAHGVWLSNTARGVVVTAVRLGSAPIASIALVGTRMPDSVLQGVSNLVAIGLERARAQDLARQVEVARRSEELRTTLIDAMAHEFKTPLTSIKAATTSLLSDSLNSPQTTRELLTIADEEADRLKSLIDDSIEMARLDTPRLEIELRPSSLPDLAREAVASIGSDLSDRRLEIECAEPLPEILLDRRLVRLAIRQLLDNALKYSPPGTPIGVRIEALSGNAILDVTDFGPGIPRLEQPRIFERFYRSPAVRQQVPGSGLGLAISHTIVQAHGGELTVTSRPGRTTFRMALPLSAPKGGRD
jgi:two-component system sensor histidine kinase KdpD